MIKFIKNLLEMSKWWSKEKDKMITCYFVKKTGEKYSLKLQNTMPLLHAPGDVAGIVKEDDFPQIGKVILYKYTMGDACSAFYEEIEEQ